MGFLQRMGFNFKFALSMTFADLICNFRVALCILDRTTVPSSFQQTGTTQKMFGPKIELLTFCLKNHPNPTNQLFPQIYAKVQERGTKIFSSCVVFAGVVF